MSLAKTMLAILALMLVFCSACEPSPGTMSITGTVREMATPYEVAGPAKNVEVKLYTYREPELPQLPPIGDVIAESTTDNSGNYEFEVRLEALPADCVRLVVFVDDGYMGWKTVAVGEDIIGVDLAKGAIPLPTQ